VNFAEFTIFYSTEQNILDNATFNRVNISTNQNETDSKQSKIQRKILPVVKNLKKNICKPKVSRLLPNLCDLQKQTIA
jgi:hypothetical protein